MQQINKEKLVYLRQWVGNKVFVLAIEDKQYTGILTNIVFDGTRLMYLMLDDRVCINYEYILEVRLEK
jgi:RNase P/RNase MRP subunit p29